ncbi:hypothetical protein TanjilG_32571 [Lupinus angustifolius]|uniref:RING-type E3 ubiquitin transferase n=2 Tax=Lupinus angustifolius TaxID=3871 RepID=A0A4P1R8X3_LUPAN|nr:hypothetical protein TanjilG_32571 [Lupinus angustifolius]
MNSLSQLVQNMFSNNNIMLVAIVSLLLVILFVLLLHIYAKFFLSPAQPRRLRTPATVEPSRMHHFHFIETSPISTKGLDFPTVSRIPMFVYEAETKELECVICLSGFEEGEIGRRLPKCGHAFHLECIDMWLSSHCTCPICRAHIVVQNNDGDDDDMLQIVIGTSEGESVNDNYRGGGVSVSQTSSSLLLACSFKRMLSTVFQSSNPM